MWRKVTCKNFKTCGATASDRSEARITGGAKEA